MLWSLENEYLLYINCINLYGDRMDRFEKAMAGYFQCRFGPLTQPA